MAVLESPPVSCRERRDDGDPTIVWLQGDHDISTVSTLSESIAAAIALDTDLVVDLSGVQFMGVVTVDLLRQARERLGLTSRSLTLRSPSPRAERVIGLCGLALGSGALAPNP